MPTKRKQSIPLLSIIIVNYNVRDFLHHALVSLQKAMKGIRGEIVVVDNASDDGSIEMVRRRFPAAQLIVNKDNLGFAKANNLGLKRSRGKYLLLINPDTLVQEDTLRVMLRFFEDNRDVGLAGCKILNPDGTFQLACRRSFPRPWAAFTKMAGLSALFPHSRLFGRYNLTYLSPDETYELDAVSGSFMMVRREAYEQVGGLDEDFFMYGEDLDWCYRIQKAGWKNYYVHSTQIIHYKGESTKRSSLNEIRTFYQAMHLFVQKHLSNSRIFGLFLIRFTISISSRLAIAKAFLKPLAVSVVDILLVDLSLVLAEWIWFGTIFVSPRRRIHYLHGSGGRCHLWIVLGRGLYLPSDVHLPDDCCDGSEFRVHFGSRLLLQRLRIQPRRDDHIGRPRHHVPSAVAILPPHDGPEFVSGKAQYSRSAHADRWDRQIGAGALAAFA